MAASTYNFPDHVSGDTFDGMKFQMQKRVSGVTSYINLTDANIEMVVKNYQTGGVVTRYNLTNSLSITDATIGKWQFNQSIVDLPVGLYKHEIIFTLSGNVKKTYIKGTWPIIEN